MSDVEKETELTQEEKLEAARKKFEKLKKKKKKDKKDKKEKKDVKEGDNEGDKEEDKGEGEGEEEHKEEENVEGKVEIEEQKEKKEEKVEDKEEKVEIKEAEEKNKESKVNNLFENESDDADDDFLNELNANAEPPQIESAREKQLHEKLDVANKQNETLKKENSNLKFEKMDLLDEIETLKETVASLKLAMAKNKVDNGVENSDLDDLGSSELSLSPNLKPKSSHYGNYTPQYAMPQPHQSVAPQEYQPPSYEELKVEMEKYKDWVLDMRQWRSVGFGPVLEI